MRVSFGHETRIMTARAARISSDYSYARGDLLLSKNIFLGGQARLARGIGRGTRIDRFEKGGKRSGKAGVGGWQGIRGNASCATVT